MKPLPRLPFGDAFSQTETDVRAFSDRMSAVISSLNAYDALGDVNEFRSKTSTLNVNGLFMVASANSPVCIDVGGSNDLTLMVPFFGVNRSLVDGKAMEWAAHRNAIFFPRIGRGGTAGYRSTLTLNLDQKRLNSVASGMLGVGEEDPVNLHLDQERLLPLVVNRANFDLTLRHICQLIDAHQQQPDVLNMLGLDDMVYRIGVTLLGRDVFLRDAFAAQEVRTPYKPVRRQLDQLCNQLTSQLDARITLSDMERLSGLSARALQYAFLSRFACTPMQWLRNERLALAHTQLRTRPTVQTVTQIALSCGFTHLSAFTNFYSKRYGELPSATLKR